MPRPAGSERFWNLYSLTYDAIGFSIPYRRHLDALVEALSLQPGSRVLDIGCGTGNLEVALAPRLPRGATVLGIDNSEGMLRRAAGKSSARSGISFVRTDLCEPLPFEDGSFDRVVANNVLYALEDRPRLLAEVLRVLAPGGTFVLSDPKPDARIAALVAEHFRAVARMPLPRRILEIAKSLVTLPLMGLAPIMLSTLVIGERVRAGDYRFSSRGELDAMLSGFATMAVSSAYAGQSWMAVAVKRGAERVA